MSTLNINFKTATPGPLPPVHDIDTDVLYVGLPSGWRPLMECVGDVEYTDEVSFIIKNGQELLDMLSNDLVTYEQWLEEVNKHVVVRTGGFGINDLVDYPTRSDYDGGMEPSETAEAIVENDGTFL